MTPEVALLCPTTRATWLKAVSVSLRYVGGGCTGLPGLVPCAGDLAAGYVRCGSRGERSGEMEALVGAMWQGVTGDLEGLGVAL